MSRRRPVQWGLTPLLCIGLLLCWGLSWNPSASASTQQETQEFQHLSDTALLERAIQLYRQSGDCDEPIRLYHVLLSRQPSEALQLAALFNQGKCFEQRRFWAEALANYQQLIEQFPQAPARVDALFRQGVVLEQLGQHAQATTRFQQVRRLGSTLTDADQRALTVQLAWQDLMRGHPRRALRHVQPVRAAWTQLSEEERRPERFYQAKAEILYGLVLSRYASEAGLVPEKPREHLGLWWARRRGQEQVWLKRHFSRWETRMQAARAHNEAAIKLGVNPWVAAGYYGLGTDGLRFLRAIRQAPIPEALSDDDSVQYREAVHHRTHAYLQDAAQLLVQGHEQAIGRSDRSAWAQLLAELARLIDEEGLEGLQTLDPGWPWLQQQLQGAGGSDAELIRPLR
ncbi:MAG: tetratricopeptide repeat protein [Myxococcota bacterium]